MRQDYNLHLYVRLHVTRISRKLGTCECVYICNDRRATYDLVKVSTSIANQICQFKGESSKFVGQKMNTSPIC